MEFAARPSLAGPVALVVPPAAGNAARHPSRDADREWWVAPDLELVGRAAELLVVDEALQRLARTGGTVEVSGPAGIGKSALLDWVRRRAADLDYRVLSASGTASEARWPFAGLHELLAPLLDGAGALPPPQRAAVSVAFGFGTGSPDSFLVALGALNLLAAAADRRPVVLVVDDVGRLDRQTRRALGFVARRLAGDRVLVVAAARAADELQLASRRGEQLALRPLDEPSARRLLQRHGPDLTPAARGTILTLAGGNPLGLVELPKGWRRGPAPIDLGRGPSVPLTAPLVDAFAAGLDGLGEVARDVLLVLAVADEESTAELLDAVAILSGRPVAARVLDATVESGLVSFERHQLEFRHPLARAAVLHAEPPRRHHAAHDAIAHALGGDLVRSTWHRAQAVTGYDDAVADQLEHVARVRARDGATCIALERAAQLTRDPERRRRRFLVAAERAFDRGRPDIVNRVLAAASDDLASQPESAGSGWAYEIFHDGIPGDAARVTELCLMARRAADGRDDELALSSLMAASLRCWWADAGELAPRMVVWETVRLSTAADHPRHAATVALADPVRAGRWVHDALVRIDPARMRDADDLRLLGQAAHALSDPVRALTFLERAVPRLREQEQRGLLAQALTMSLIERMELGWWDGLEAGLDEAEALSRDTGQPLWATAAVAARALAAGLRGRVEHALELAARVELFAGQHQVSSLLADARLARAQALLSSNRYRPAYVALRSVVDPADPTCQLRQRLRGVMTFADAALYANEVPDAQEVLSRLDESFGGAAGPSAHLQLVYARAVLADDVFAEERFHAALEAGLVRWPLARARLELAFGSWLRRHRRPAHAREPLRSAERAFAAIGATCWLEIARRELRAAGDVGVGGRRPTPGELLSAQELHVAQLVAEGLSNKQIGERLYLSPRTVGSHLYRIFPKLDVTSRGQLAARIRNG